MKAETVTIQGEPAAGAGAVPREPTRARCPDGEGYVERDGVKVFWELYGEGEQTILFLPTWSMVHSRIWKAQIPYLARHFRVLAFDGRGNGKSDRPADAAAYASKELGADALAVMDATGTERAVTVSLSAGTMWNLFLAATQPQRVSAAVFIGSFYPLAGPLPEWMTQAFNEPLPSCEGAAMFNRHAWAADHRGFVELWLESCFPEPHSTRPIEHGVEMGLETTPDVLIATVDAAGAAEVERLADLVGSMGPALQQLARQIRCPVLVVHGDRDWNSPPEWGRALAEDTGGTLLTFEGSGHCPHARDPVRFNLALRDFVEPRRPVSSTWVRGGARRRRALFISSPIGLGHARRDVAIARELRELHPDLEIDWLAQHPVTEVLEGEGETVHPASRHLANESRHFESESAEHDLHCFQSWRRMDEILCANFMLFHDVVEEDGYDLWIGDEAWELDHFLHENPELKRAAYCWLTDFVGFLPMPDGGEREAHLAADYNAEMVEHVARYPRLRDRSLFVGNPDDIVDERLGPDLPTIRDWTERHFDFAGYVTGFDPAELRDREELRAKLGYAPDERVCIVTVGGSGVGGDLLRRVIAAYPEAKERAPELRMVVVAGPRIDPESLPKADGLEVRAYVHNLYRHLAACDLAVVQGGLTTGMELTANKRPFLYFPLGHHFEQQFHVRHRLDRYGAGRRMDYDDSPPEAIAEAIAQELGREVSYRDVETDGARRAAERIAELL